MFALFCTYGLPFTTCLHVPIFKQKTKENQKFVIQSFQFIPIQVAGRNLNSRCLIIQIEGNF